MITVNHNGETITGALNGKSYAIPYKEEWYQKLDTKAKLANTASTPKYSKELHTSFQNSLNAMKGASKNNKGAVVEDTKLGTATLSIVPKPNEDLTKVYLFNGKAYSKFYLPQGLVDRIQTNKSKGLSVDPEIKFFVRANRGQVMTQIKLNRLVEYINKTYVDTDMVIDLEEQGFSREEATKRSTVFQVPLTNEGLLNTYKVSTLIGEVNNQSGYVNDHRKDYEEVAVEVVEAVKGAEVDLTHFKFVPIRNNKGHFLKRGSDDYVAEYNRQLEEFKRTLTNGQTAVTKSVVTSKAGKDAPLVKTVVVDEAKSKTAEDYIFQPAYQGNDGDSFYCGDVLGHIIKVGKLHRLSSWSQVDTNDNNTACPGLHVGGRDYIRGYETNTWNTKGTKIVHNVFVDPQFVGAVVSVENGDGAMRVKEYFVHSSFIGINGSTYNSSDYAKLTDEEWDNQLADALVVVEETDRKIAELEAAKAKAQSIVDNAF